MSDFVAGFARTKKRRPPRRSAPVDIIDDTAHVHHCNLRLFNGEKCTRVIGPYFNRTYFREALAQHLAAQHVNDLAPMGTPDKADARMWRVDRDPDGYEAPTY